MLQVYLVLDILAQYSAGLTCVTNIFGIWYLEYSMPPQYAVLTSCTDVLTSALTFQYRGGAQIPNTKYTCNTRNKLLLEQLVHLTNHTAGHSRPGTTHLAA